MLWLIFIFIFLADDECNDYLDKVADESEETKGTFRFLCSTPHLKKGLILGLVSMQLTTAIWPIIYFSTEFLRRANIDYDLSESFSSCMLIISTISTIIGMLVMENFSRRKLFIFVSTINTSALVLFVICSQIQPYVDFVKYGCVLAIFFHGVTYR